MLLLLLCWCCSAQLIAAGTYGPSDKAKADGTLYGDVYNWADMIQNYIQQLADEGIRKDYTQVSTTGLGVVLRTVELELSLFRRRNFR